MGLDACVYCDCFETGKMRVQPAPNWMVHVDVDGARVADTEELDQALLFDQWNFNGCEHQFGMFLHFRIGNINEVGLLRAELTKTANNFSFILTRVIYNGIHASDHIKTDEVVRLSHELQSLAGLHSKLRSTEQFLRRFEDQLNRLVDASTTVNKPIVFC